ncbi:MAG: choice-of-anchor L domain-containing protein [Verrucomicrobiae bacterium]|nr:choice-of-anchor L domain-containing protein [Verrucomicrobiae bacterium]
MNNKSSMRNAALFTLLAIAYVARLEGGISTTQATATQVAQTLVPSSSSLTLSSISSQGGSQQRGTFTALATDQVGNGNMTNGVILSTGNIASASSAQSTVASTSTSSGSNSAFTALMNGQTSGDVSYVEFTVYNPEYATRTIYLYFTFASEEYPDYVNNLFNDAMGIWVNGVNQATLYGDPITIENVNDQVNYLNWFNNYDSSLPRYRAANFVYGGYTFTWYITIQVPYNTSKTIRVGVADGNDTSLDSAVFLRTSISW